jgi:hypothetical protein
MKQFLLTLFLCSITFLLSSQEIKKGPAYDYARKIVDTMASESMHGRGYVNSGDSIAANYMRSEFKKFGLRSIGKDHYQNFSFPINTFPEVDTFYFALSDKSGKSFVFKGITGNNFLIYASSPGTTNYFPIQVFDSTCAVSERSFRKFSKKVSKNGFILVDDRNVADKNKIVFFDRIKKNELKASGIILLQKKLTWEESQTVSDHVKIEILADSFNFNDYKRAEGKARVSFKNKFLPDHVSQNVIGYVQGSVHPDSFIVFSAHYDHLGQMGKTTYFPGANDNASGCAMLLNLVSYYSRPENKPKCSIAFISFGGEEAGLVGSKYYTEHPLFPLKNIKFLLNMDIMGTGEDGITVVNGAIFKDEFEKLKEINSKNNLIKEVKIRGKAANSDHYFFSEKGVKAFFIYALGGIKAYHDIYDRPETLPLNEFENMFDLIIKFTDDLVNE